LWLVDRDLFRPSLGELSIVSRVYGIPLDVSNIARARTRPLLGLLRR
jgi:hypothetical protein